MGGRERVHPCERHGKPRLLAYHQQGCLDRMVRMHGDTLGKADLEITYNDNCHVQDLVPIPNRLLVFLDWIFRSM